jgi:hypothetical protein
LLYKVKLSDRDMSTEGISLGRLPGPLKDITKVQASHVRKPAAASIPAIHPRVLVSTVAGLDFDITLQSGYTS